MQRRKFGEASAGLGVRMEAAAVPTSASFGIAGMPVAKANNNANAKVKS